MSSVLHDPEGLLGAVMPLDREPYVSLVHAVLALPETADLPQGDCDQITLQLTGHGRAVADDVRQRCARLPQDAQARMLAAVVLDEAERRLSAPRLGTVRCVQQRARMVRALYERLDRLDSMRLTSPPTRLHKGEATRPVGQSRPPVP
ncbi:DUF6415 family natural product biosynthesis protein [Streptomyces bambusae]|uniref:DUF6415 family natural product biosynthesis protein n=1 Tax=Streptomyces bambusae TaxID=1550616 RepID=UPI001CFCC3D0|nr:DUF6415 family natural product biosynthesis protein [Streptomyces bambusae]MCB5166524.1 DUF6415 family natural product biosynthesis protein [Streptomyces bambusae]